MATFAIGDVQGCFEELRELVDKIAFDPKRDRLWFVGDLVNRGPDSLAVLRYVRGLGDRAITVLGNHDLHLISVATGFARLRDDDTLSDVLKARDRDELIDWLRGLPMMHVEGDMALVHAGLLPQWSLDKAATLAGEVEAALRGPKHVKFLEHLYGSKPARWKDSLKGWDRLRVIVNAMTRMRFCTADGELDFKSKGESTSAPPGFLPWFEVAGRKSAGTTLICGHWSALGLRVMPDVLALDSGCVWGGKLTAIRLEDRQLTQVASRLTPVAFARVNPPGS
ncbi:MAG: symmetrical bis(5'-nucleosyl)-tetraphosphatase [Betaproteobacteria bacterium]|nr:symmetrical bis(5'-nucleosyl)-tetraphosphatase [Betaproteobacteria bacterium]